MLTSSKACCLRLQLVFTRQSTSHVSTQATRQHMTLRIRHADPHNLAPVLRNY